MRFSRFLVCFSHISFFMSTLNVLRWNLAIVGRLIFRRKMVYFLHDHDVSSTLHNFGDFHKIVFEIGEILEISAKSFHW